MLDSETLNNNNNKKDDLIKIRVNKEFKELIKIHYKKNNYSSLSEYVIDLIIKDIKK